MVPLSRMVAPHEVQGTQIIQLLIPPSNHSLNYYLTGMECARSRAQAPPSSQYVCRLAPNLGPDRVQSTHPILHLASVAVFGLLQLEYILGWLPPNSHNPFLTTNKGDCAMAQASSLVRGEL